ASLAERVLRPRVTALAHFGGEHAGGFPDIFRQCRVFLDEFCRELIVQAEHVVQHDMLGMSCSTSTWPSHAGPAPIPMVGIVSDLVICDASGAGTSSRTTANAPASWRAVA